MLSMQKIKKIHYLFPTLPPEQRARLKFDEVAIYSVTDQWTADVISRRLLQFLPSSATVHNATACVGGNTWSFSKHFSKVVAIEMDALRFEYLVHNINVLNARNVTAIKGDAIDVRGIILALGDPEDVINLHPRQPCI